MHKVLRSPNLLWRLQKLTLMLKSILAIAAIDAQFAGLFTKPQLICKTLGGA